MFITLICFQPGECARQRQSAMRIRRMLDHAYSTPRHTLLICSTKTEQATTPNVQTLSLLFTTLYQYCSILGWLRVYNSNCSRDGLPALKYSSTEKPDFNGKPLLLHPLLLVFISGTFVIICACNPYWPHWATKGFVINARLSDQLDR